MNTELTVEEIFETKQYHRLFELSLSPTKRVESLKKAFVPALSTRMFKTRKSRDLLTQLLKKLKSFLHTPYGKTLSYTFMPTLDKTEIQSRQELCTSSLKHTIATEEFHHLLLQATQLRYTAEKKHNGICIAFADEDLYHQLKSVLSKKYFVTFIESEADFLHITHYEHIRFIKTISTPLVRSAKELEQVTIIESEELLDIAPELITDVLELYQESFQALEELSNHFTFSLSLPKCSQLNKRESFSTIYEQISTQCQSFQSTITQAISQAQFSGSQLITLVQQKKNVLDCLDEYTAKTIQEEKSLLHKNIEALTGFSSLELFSLNALGEVVIDDQELKRLEKQYYASLEESALTKKTKQAKLWEPYMKQLPFLIEELYHYELQIGLRDFIGAYDLSLPTISEKGLSFVYGKNMNIEGATPVEYYVGLKEQVAIITGANSGGKTTLLELLAQIQILTQMGLYVPAKDAQVSLVDEIYYFSKNTGSLSAGAFETLLKQFSSISTDQTRKLILADEIESVTEPDVAAKIIKGIISYLLTSPKNTLVLVTHMGRELQELEVQGRFDGIEAKGLDEQLNLVVDRNPVIGRIARSTPQLIIERLAKLDESPFYGNLKRLIA